MSFFTDTEEPNEAAWALINRLNKKLELKGYRAERPRTYQIVPIDISLVRKD